MKILLAVLNICFGCSVATLIDNLCPETTALTWEGGPINFPSNSIEKLSSATGQYISKNIVATKAAFHLDKIILLTSRFKRGNPCSLVIYDKLMKLGEPVFDPYPSLEDHEEGNCAAIQNAVDFYKDHLGFLWVLDSGVVNNLMSPSTLCPPKVVCISLLTGKILKTLDISSLADENSRLQHIVVDYDILGKVHLYISDAASHAILVYDIEKDVGYRAVLPECVTNTVEPFDTLYLAITKCLLGKSTLYLTYLNSPNIFSIKTDYLKKGKQRGKIIDVGSKVAPMVFLGVDKHELYFRYRNEPEIYRWNTHEEFCPETLRSVFVSEDGFLPTSVALDVLKGKMKVIQSNFQDYLGDTCGVGVIHQIVDM
ncbi:major royal jelly protein 1-like [Arctopsyche grandis]|uniref:major royal jelly protein 1-like n=1 Tax=Arctopsyche grandis TaxID=121162 RepID=UPI00406DA4C8